MKKRKRIPLLGMALCLISVLNLTACKSKPVTAEQSATAPEKTAASPQSDTFTAFTTALHEKISAHWPHMNKIWPAYDYNNHNLVLFQLTDEGNVSGAVLINTRERRLLEKSEYETIAPPMDDGYEEIMFDGKPSIAMSVTQQSMSQKNAVDLTYRVATHEIVHFYYQGDAMFSTDGENRAQNLPLEKTPRLYRQMIYQSLIDAYDNPGDDQEHLGRAKYWLEKWKSEFSKEYEDIKSTDIAESTARYSDNLSTLVTADSTTVDLYQGANKDIMRSKIFYSADDESYEIGFVASLLLDRHLPGWKDSFYKSRLTAEELLLKDVPAVPEHMDPEMEAKVSSAIESYNAKSIAAIQDLADAKKDISVPYLKIDTTASTSSMMAAGVVRYDGDQITLEYSNQFKAGGKSIEFHQANVIDSVDHEGNQFLYIPLPMISTAKGDILTVDTKKLKVDSVKVSTHTEDGRTIYFIKADE